MTPKPAVYDLTELLPRLPQGAITDQEIEEADPTPDGLADLLLRPIRSRDTVIPDWIGITVLTVIVVLMLVFAIMAARKLEAAQWERPVRVQVTERTGR